MQVNGKYVSVHVGSEMLGLTPQRVTQMCRAGVFKTAHKPGYGKNSHWRILRNEIRLHIWSHHGYVET